MCRYRCVAVGGTFDVLHIGHQALLSKSFELGHEVVIGITSDEFALRLGKVLDRGYDERFSMIREFLKEVFPDSKYSIWKLDNYFGPAILLDRVEAIVVSTETYHRVKIANEERKKRGLDSLKVEVVSLVNADNGMPISTRRIRRGEIDSEGHQIKHGNLD